MVTAGNWLWWFTPSGLMGLVSIFTKVDSGTTEPEDERTYSLSSVARSPSISGGTSSTT